MQIPNICINIRLFAVINVFISLLFVAIIVIQFYTIGQRSTGSTTQIPTRQSVGQPQLVLGYTKDEEKMAISLLIQSKLRL